MHIVPEWLQTAFAEWITGRLYVDGRGNYRSRVLGRPRCIVGYNRPLRHAYPRNDDFHRAAHRWLSLWELVPTARLTGERSSQGVQR
jgi:hypothetical protein